MSRNRKEIRVDNAANIKKPKDVIYDPRGQWKYPGMITRIPGGNITMHGVNYPVLGVDSLGNSQMMMPGMDYLFPGNYVTEYPMMQYGGLTLMPNEDTNVFVPRDDKAWMIEWIKNRQVADPSMQAIYDSQKEARLKSLGNTSIEYGNPKYPTTKNITPGLPTGDAKIKIILPEGPNQYQAKQHEISHAGDMLGRGISPEEREIISKNLFLPYWARSRKERKYWSNPTEVKARLNTLRQEFKLDPTKQYDRKNLKYSDLLKSTNPEVQEILNITTPETIYNLLNETSQVESNEDLQYARYGAIMQKGGIKYGTPEYAAAYRQGKIARQVGDEFILPDLPEAVVTGVDPRSIDPYTGQRYAMWDQLSDDYKKVIDDPGPIGINARNRARSGHASASDYLKWTRDELIKAGAEATGIPSMYRVATGEGDVWDYLGTMGALGVGMKTLSRSPKVKAFVNESKETFKDIVQNLDNKYITPIQFKKEIKELKALINKTPEYFSQPEVVERLRGLNINPFVLQFKKPRVTNLSGQGSHYSSTLDNINIDFRQLKDLKKKGYELPLNTVYEHELAHKLQAEAYKNSPEFRKSFAKYMQDPKSNIAPFSSTNPTSLDDAASAYLRNKPSDDFGIGSYDYFHYDYSGRGKVEPLAHLREMRQNMINKGYIKNELDDISVETLNKFIKENPRDRMSSFLATDDKNLRQLKKLFDNLPVATGVGAGTYTLQQEQNTEKYKRGGKLSRYTNKNIRSSINELLKRNKDLFGEAGKRYFKPYQTGGIALRDNLVPTQDLTKKDHKVIKSLVGAISNGEPIQPIEVEQAEDGLRIKDGHHRYLAYTQLGIDQVPVKIISDMKKKKNGGEAFPQQPTAAEFFNRGYVPNSPVGFYMHGGTNTNEIAFPQQPAARVFFGAFPWSYQTGGSMTGIDPSVPIISPPVYPLPLMPNPDQFQTPAPYVKPAPKVRTPVSIKFGELDPETNAKANWLRKQAARESALQGMARGGQPCYECGGYHMQDGGISDMSEMYDAYESSFRKGGWIQKATESIKRRGTEGVCTGAKFGSKSCPPGSKRYNLAKTFRAMAKNRQDGGQADGLDQDDYLGQYNRLFMDKIRSNTMDAIATDAANQFMAQYGTEVNPMTAMNNQMLESQMAGIEDKNRGVFGNLYGATMNAFGNSNPYMQQRITKAQQGGNTPSYLTKEDLNNWWTEIQKQNQSKNYSPSYQSHYNYNPIGGYNRFPANYNAYSQFRMPQVNYNPNNTFLQNYEYRGRLFGQGPRKVSMTFRTYRDPQTGEVKQAPANNQVIDKGSGTSFLGLLSTTAPAGYNPNTWGQGSNKPASDAWIESNLNEEGIYTPQNRYGGYYAQNGLQIMDNPDLYPYITPQVKYDQPQGEFEDWTVTEKFKRNMRGEDKANWALAGIDAASALMRQRDYNKMDAQMSKNTLADNAMTVMPANQVGKRGRYNWTGMSSGMMDPANMVPIQQPGQNYNMEGFVTPYQEGGVYELSDEEIDYIKRNGGTVTYVD